MSDGRVVSAWRRYDGWLAASSSRLHADLLPPSADDEIDAFESEIGSPLPIELKDLWRLSGGQATIDAGVGVFPHLDFLGPHAALQEWRVWRQVREDSSPEEMALMSSSSESTPVGAIALTYSLKGWIPVWREEMVANYVGVDIEPGATGSTGQIISFGRERDSKVVLAKSIGAFLEFVASEAEIGRVNIVTDSQSGDVYLRHEDGPVIDVISEMVRSGGPLE